MKRVGMILLVAGMCMEIPAAAHAQMGMDFIKKPAIASVVNPVVGKGALYQTKRRDQDNEAAETQELSVVGKDTVEGKEAFWLAFAHADRKTGEMTYGKILFTKDDFQFHRMIVQQSGQQAMEMPFRPAERTKQHMHEEIEKWHEVGTETITVPAGTFSCQHWKKEGGDSDIWASDKISPFGMVKEVTPGSEMVLVKVITDAKDHITGPVKQFDPEEMKRQMMEQMQKGRLPKP